MGILSLATLIKYWKEIAFGLVVVAFVGYITFIKAEVSHYKAKVVSLQTELDLQAAKAKQAEAVAKQKAAEITTAHEDSLRIQNDLKDKNDKLVQENIKANEELKRIKLSLSLVQLWNSSKQSNSDAATTKQGNVDAASAAKDTPTSAFEGGVTLDKLFAVSAENDKNHLKCIDQVNEWIDFWQQYQEEVRAVRSIN